MKSHLWQWGVGSFILGGTVWIWLILHSLKYYLLSQVKIIKWMKHYIGGAKSNFKLKKYCCKFTFVTMKLKNARNVDFWSMSSFLFPFSKSLFQFFFVIVVHYMCWIDAIINLCMDLYDKKMLFFCILKNIMLYI